MSNQAPVQSSGGPSVSSGGYNQPPGPEGQQLIARMNVAVPRNPRTKRDSTLIPRPVNGDQMASAVINKKLAYTMEIRSANEYFQMTKPALDAEFASLGCTTGKRLPLPSDSIMLALVKTLFEAMVNTNMIYDSLPKAARVSVSVKRMGSDHYQALYLEKRCWEIVIRAYHSQGAKQQIQGKTSFGNPRYKPYPDWEVRLFHLIRCCEDSKSFCEKLLEDTFLARALDDPNYEMDKVLANLAQNQRKGVTMAKGNEAIKTEAEKEAHEIICETLGISKQMSKTIVQEYSLLELRVYGRALNFPLAKCYWEFPAGYPERAKGFAGLRQYVYQKADPEGLNWKLIGHLGIVVPRFKDIARARGELNDDDSVNDEASQKSFFKVDAVTFREEALGMIDNVNGIYEEYDCWDQHGNAL